MMPRAYLTVREVADLIGWPARRTRRWLIRHGATIRPGDSRQSRHLVPVDKLQSIFPDAWDRWVAKLEVEES